jgi:hypothetical protein
MADKIKKWFKGSPLYFWIVLVVWQSLKQAIPISEFKGRIMELIISLLAGFISVVLLGQAGQIPDVGINLYTLAVWLGVTVILRVLVGIFTLPASLYQGMEAEANKRKWVNVSINIPKVFEVNPHGACLEIANHKKGWAIQKAGIKLIRVIEGNRAMLETILENDDVWIPRSRGGVLYPRGTIHPSENGVYSIAHWNGNEAWMNRMDNLSISEKIPLKKDVPYIITLKFIGEVDGKWMDENQRRYALRYVNQKVELKELT